MKCCHSIDGSLPLCLDGSGGSEAPSPIGAAGLGGLGCGGSLGAPNPSGALTSI